jgi:hypothetical protein
MGTLRRSTATPILVGLLAVAGCDDPTRPVTDVLELVMERGVAVAVSDTAVVVDGQRRLGLPRSDQALAITFQASFEYGGIGRFGTGRLWSEGRFGRFGYQDVEHRGDTVVVSFHDFGDVLMAGEPMGKITEIPDITGTPPYPLEFENFVHYHNTTYHRVAWVDGGEQTFVEAPFDAALASGGDVHLTASGSPTGAPFDVAFRTRPLPALIGLGNGTPLDYRNTRPVLDIREPLLLEFDRRLDPDRSAFVLLPWNEGLSPESRRAATAFGWPDRAAARVALPAGTLTEVLDATGADNYEFVLFVLQFRHQDDVVTTTDPSTGTDLHMPLVQTAITRFFLRLVR